MRQALKLLYSDQVIRKDNEMPIKVLYIRRTLGERMENRYNDLGIVGVIENGCGWQYIELSHKGVR